jgi:hypothetical protein
MSLMLSERPTLAEPPTARARNCQESVPPVPCDAAFLRVVRHYALTAAEIAQVEAAWRNDPAAAGECFAALAREIGPA